MPKIENRNNKLLHLHKQNVTVFFDKLEVKMHDKLQLHISNTDSYIKNLFFSLAPLYREEFAFGQDITVPLFTVLHSYSESVLVLLQNGGLFEADIILRCTMEGTIRYCYLMTGSEEERKEKYTEYRVIMPDLDRLNDHRKAQEAITILKQFTKNSTKPFESMLLSEEEINQIQNQYARSFKDRLKKKWSYQSLLKELASSHMEYEAQLGSLSTYALTSHYCHLDYTGLNDIKCQLFAAGRNEKTLSDYAHSLRIIANILSFYVFRVLEYMRCNNSYPENVKKLCLDAIQYEQKVNAELNSIIDAELL